MKVQKETAYMVLVSLLILAFADASIDLGEHNFTSFVTGAPISLVLFYAPWCGHSKQFLPVFEEIANQLAEHSVDAGKVDCVANPEVYWSNEIQGFPQLKVFFGDGSYNNPILYKGDRNLDDVVEFVKKQFQSSIIEPNLVQADFELFCSEFLKPANPVLILYSPLTTDHKPLQNRLEFICKQLDILRCAFSIDENLATDLGVNPSLTKYVMIRDFPNEASIVSTPVPLNVIGQDDIISVSWVKQSAFPLLVEFTPENTPLMFSDNRPGYNTHIVFILNSKIEGFGDNENLLRDLAKSPEFVGKCVFVYIDAGKVGTAFVDDILEDLGVVYDGSPHAIIVQSIKTSVQFYQLESFRMSKEVLFDWISDFQQNKLIPSKEIKMKEA